MVFFNSVEVSVIISATFVFKISVLRFINLLFTAKDGKMGEKLLKLPEKSLVGEGKFSDKKGNISKRSLGTVNGAGF